MRSHETTMEVDEGPIWEDEFRQVCLHKKPFFTATFLGGCNDSGRMHERNYSLEN